MNNTRRKAIEKSLSRLEELMEELATLRDEIDDLRQEEEDYLDNMPENLQGSSRYEMAEEAMESLQAAVDLLDELDFEEITGYLQEAME